VSERVALSPGLIQDLLASDGIKFFIDNDGDIGTLWDSCYIYFFLHGQAAEILQVRAYLTKQFDIAAKPALLQLLDEWNRTKMFPKAYSSTDDLGRVTISAEHTFDFEPGVAEDLLRFTLTGWISTLLRFAEWMEKRT
jgi:hypothetical protein